MTAESGLREVVWQLALELGKVTGDTSDVETPQDRHLGFAIKQELEHRLDAMLRRVRACRQSLAEIQRLKNDFITCQDQTSRPFRDADK
jgi:hypothetical protein